MNTAKGGDEISVEDDSEIATPLATKVANSFAAHRLADHRVVEPDRRQVIIDRDLLIDAMHPFQRAGVDPDQEEAVNVR